MLLNGNKEINCGITLALGYFDSVHYGHRRIISSAVDYASKNGLKSCVFTFSNDLSSFFGKDSGQIYTYEERKSKLFSLGVDEIISFEFNQDFQNLNKKQFLEVLSEKYRIEKVFCGYDYTFGKGREGNVDFLTEYFGKDRVKVFDCIELDGKRVSTSLIKELLKDGNICQANKFLSEPYSIYGRIVKGRGEGHVYGFPTANLQCPTNKTLPKRGVYATFTTVGEKRYKSVTNVGAKPTFSIMGDSIESLLVDFSGDLYGKNVTLEFVSYLRDTKAFNNPEELRYQIFEDVKKCEELC